MSEMSSSALMTLLPIPRGKLAETVANQLIGQLRDKKLRVGTRIPSERELMSSFGVGRSTVREAVNGLAMLGVLEIRHGQGAFVADPKVGQLPDAIAAALARGVTRDLFEARRVVEIRVARLAAERRTQSDLRELDQALADHEAAIELGTSAVEPAVRFHVQLGESSHNSVLSSFVSSFVELMTTRGPRLEAKPGYRAWEIDQHRAVFEPIHTGNPELAEERMRTHLEAVIAHHEGLGLP